MLFDSTLRRDLSRTFGATLVVILTIVLTMLLIRVVGLAAKGQVSPQDVALLLGYLTLGQLPLMLILSLFIAVVATLGRMYRESEMAIWFASGVGIRRFVRPVLRMSVPVLVFIAVLTMFVWPWGNQNSSELRARYEKRSDLSRVAPGQFQSSSDGRRVFFIDRSREDEHKAANVFILQSEADTESVTSARSGSIEDRDGDSVLVLQRGQRNEADRKTGEKTLSRFETYSIVVGEREMSRLDKPPPKARSTFDLLREGTPEAQGELTWRVGLVLGGANFLLLGIGLAATSPRKANNWNLLFALLAFVVYFNLINLTQAWVANGRAGMAVALAALHGVVFVGALALLWWRDYGTVRGPRWQRPARPPGPPSANTGKATGQAA